MASLYNADGSMKKVHTGTAKGTVKPSTSSVGINYSNLLKNIGDITASARGAAANASTAAANARNTMSRSTPAPRATQSYGGGYGGGGGGTAAPIVPRISDEDYLASGADAGYMAQIAALKNSLEQYTNDVTAQRGKYDVDYEETLRNLGWMPGNEEEGTPAGWNWHDMATSSARSRDNLQNDFAGRGMLQSSAFDSSLNDLVRSLSDQQGGLETGRTNFMDDLDRQLQAFQTENTLSQQQARADAIARRAMTIGI